MRCLGALVRVTARVFDAKKHAVGSQVIRYGFCSSLIRSLGDVLRPEDKQACFLPSFTNADGCN